MTNVLTISSEFSTQQFSQGELRFGIQLLKLIRSLFAAHNISSLSSNASWESSYIATELKQLAELFSSSLLKRISTHFEKLHEHNFKHWADESAAPGSIADLIYQAELLLLQDSAKKEGVFFTPESLARQMVSAVIQKKRFDPEQHCLLDPACGAGIFLVESFYQISSQLKFGFEDCSALLQNHFFGVEKSPVSAELCRLMLQLALLEKFKITPYDAKALPRLSGNICVGNGLISTTDLKPEEQSYCTDLTPFDWEFGSRPIDKFDFIFGNPPYGLSRDRQISKLENAILKRCFAEHRTGKPNKYLLFMSRAARLLKQDGILSFVVPNSWLGIQSARAMRRYLLKSGLLKSIVVYQKPVFRQASVEVVTVLLKNTRAADEIEIYHASTAESKPAISCKINRKERLATAGYTIPLHWDSSIAELIGHIHKRSYRMGDSENSFFKPMIALQAYATGKGDPAQSREDVKNKIYHSSTRLDQNHYPYLIGSDVKRFITTSAGSYLKYGKWLAEPQKLERFSGPRIVLREITGRSPYLFIAAVLEETVLYNKSVLHILPQPGTTKQDLLTLLGILNSKLASFILLATGRKIQRSLFPKVVNADLKNFPIPQTPAGSNISATVSEIIQCENNKTCWDELQQQLNQQVFEYYELEPEQIKLIEGFLSRY